jgi:hypothetical protein
MDADVFARSITMAPIEPLIAKARAFVEAGESLAPIAFIGNFATGQILHVVIGTADDDATLGMVQVSPRFASLRKNRNTFTLSFAIVSPRVSGPRDTHAYSHESSLLQFCHSFYCTGYTART